MPHIDIQQSPTYGCTYACMHACACTHVPVSRKYNSNDSLQHDIIHALPHASIKSAVGYFI